MKVDAMGGESRYDAIHAANCTCIDALRYLQNSFGIHAAEELLREVIQPALRPPSTQSLAYGGVVYSRLASLFKLRGDAKEGR